MRIETAGLFKVNGRWLYIAAPIEADRKGQGVCTKAKDNVGKTR